MLNSTNEISTNLANQLVDPTHHQFLGEFMSKQWNLTGLIRPHNFTKNMKRTDLKNAIKQITNATLTDQLNVRASNPTTEYAHLAYFCIRKFKNPRESID